MCTEINWLYVVYLSHLRSIFVVGTYADTVWKLKVAIFFIVCAVMWDLHVDYISWSHDQKSHVTSCFIPLDSQNAMVPLMMIFASCNANANTKGVI